MTGETDRFDDPQVAETPRRARTPSEPLITAKLYGEEPHLCADSPESRWTMEDLTFNEELYQAKETADEAKHYQKNTTHRNTSHHIHHHHHHHNSNQLHPHRNYNYQYSNPFDYKNTSHSEFKKFMNNNNDDMDLNYLRPPSPLRHHRTRSTSLPFLTLADLPALEKQRPLRVVVLGESGVGKSSLAVQFVSSFGDYNDYESVLSENPDEVYEKTMQIDGHEVTVQIVDTPAYGQAEFEEREDELLQGGDAYILVYSITSRRSFKKANELRFKLQRTQETEMVPIILVGNKTDLERSREVPFAEGKHFAALFDCKLIETSASLSHNVEKLFNGVVQQIRLRRERRHSEEEMETGSGDSSDSLKGSPTRERQRSSPSKKSRRPSMLKRARGAIGRLLRRKSGDEPTPGYRARSKSCHVMEVL
ncbi:GTP-binding protein REM 1-like [Lytechinus variegatus]|uniref:GTP-binding protein REM 1-like n=1 Tax=Lytechinus variegatus TaxID=7654 RepID=UPI001BB25E0A|nr:GTP-binding protein REM 1-like [Lytechinus variegatus]